MTDQFNMPIPNVETPKKKNTVWIIVLVVSFLLLCCCCTSAYLLWTYGDQLMAALGVTY